MVTELVGDNVCLGKVTGGTVIMLEFIEEVKVEVYLLVAGAVERSDSGTGIAAGRVHPPGEKDKRGLYIRFPQLVFEDDCPGLL